MQTSCPKAARHPLLRGRSEDPPGSGSDRDGSERWAAPPPRAAPAPRPPGPGRRRWPACRQWAPCCCPALLSLPASFPPRPAAPPPPGPRDQPAPPHASSRAGGSGPQTRPLSSRGCFFAPGGAVHVLSEQGPSSQHTASMAPPKAPPAGLCGHRGLARPGHRPEARRAGAQAAGGGSTPPHPRRLSHRAALPTPTTGGSPGEFTQ